MQNAHQNLGCDGKHLVENNADVGYSGRAFEVILVKACAGVVIGSQAPLRWVCRKAWRFKSSPAHKIKTAKAVLILVQEESSGGAFVSDIILFVK